MNVRSISIKRLLTIAAEKGITKPDIIVARAKYGAWERVGKYGFTETIRKEDIRDIASHWGINTSKRIKGWFKKPYPEIERIRETPLIKRAWKPVYTKYIRTYTKTGLGEYMYQLIVKGAYRNEKTGEVQTQIHRSHASVTKDYSAHYSDAVERPGSTPESNWVLITDENDPDYIEITIEWKMYGGKKGTSPFAIQYD